MLATRVFTPTTSGIPEHACVPHWPCSAARVARMDRSTTRDVLIRQRTGQVRDRQIANTLSTRI